MKIKHFKNSIISFILIISTILMPFSFLPKKAEAQSNISAYTSGLAPAIARLPQCQKMVGSGIKSLFNGIGNLFSNETGGTLDGGLGDISKLGGLGDISKLGGLGDISKLGGTKSNLVELPNLDNISSSATIQATITPTNSPETNNLLKKANKTLTDIQEQTQELNENSSCIQSIGRLTIKMLLQKLTLSTVNWINSGYDGSPSFIQDPKKFWKDIADNEILQFGAEIQNNPYGKDWIRNQALAYKTKFADNARYSLEDSQQTNPEFSAQRFQTDFSVGGWDAWTTLTQVPANNPLGAKIMFDNEIQKRLAGTSQSTAEAVHEALSQANGFLGDQRCISAETGQIDYDITRSQDYAAIKKNPSAPLCSTWEYVTPGKMIADYATQVTGYENNSLLNVQDLNDAVAAISDAILNQFSTSIYEKGFANLDYQGIDGVLVFNKNNSESYQSQTEKDYIPSQLSSSWLQANPDFNIRTDLTQALIDEQRTYSDKLALQNKELMSTTDGKEYVMGTNGLSNAYGLMPAIYQLDYCIPGPHPGWENDSRETLREVVLPQEPKQSSNVAGEVANGAIGVGLNFVPYVGPVLSSLFGAFSSDSDAKRQSTNIRGFYSNQLNSLTGYQPQAVYGSPQDQVSNNMATSDGFFYVMNSILDRYIKIMNKTYFSSPDILPSIKKEAAKEFNQLPGYNQIIKENKDKILEMKTTVSILGEIKDAVNALNIKYEPNNSNITEEEKTNYENELKTQINAFGRLSANMVNGDDIAAADDLAKQIIQKRDFIYKNLLKGPYGCEAFLENPNNIKPFPSAGGMIGQASNDWSNYNVNSIKRMTYPFPILYDYNNLAKGNTIPDPWTDCSVKNPPESCNNKMFADNLSSPGFLNFVHFNAIYDCNKGNPQPGEGCNSGGRVTTYNGSERLSLSGLVNDFAPGYEDERRDFSNVSVGEIGPWGGGPFEKTIGIY